MNVITEKKMITCDVLRNYRTSHARRSCGRNCRAPFSAQIITDRQKTSHGIGLEVLITAAAAADTILRYYIINHYQVCRNPTWRLFYSLNCRLNDVF